ncbi:hypothetical protein ACODT5_28800 [Streptomyces sp. 5.8]|uniref:hypothetical protein n=1 Tax=Streptomyces sp. 5.8 TaxID=3406571 RepID=UPI003BB6F5E2
MPISLQPTSLAIAMNLRWRLANSRPGAVRNTYPNGSGTCPVPVELTPEEQAANWREADRWLSRWFVHDRDGYEAFLAACAVPGSDPDPCAYCRDCR